MGNEKNDVKTDASLDVRPVTLNDLRRRAAAPTAPGGLGSALPGAPLSNPVTLPTSGFASAFGGSSSVPVNAAADLGQLIRAAREDMRLSQQRFADLAGVGRRFVSEFENGKPTLELGLVLHVCKAAGIDLFAKKRRNR